MRKPWLPATAATFAAPDFSAAPATAAGPSPKSLDDWLIPESVEADYPFLTASRLTRLRMGPDGPAFTKVGRGVAYRRGDVLDWLRAGRRTTTNERRPGAGRRKAEVA